MEHSPPTRRGFLAGLGLAGLAAAAGCAAPAALGSGRTHVRLWHFLGGGDGIILTGMLDKYRKQHPAIDLEADTLAWGEPFYTKVAMAGAGGRAPDLTTFHMARLPGFGPGRLLDPVDLDLLTEVGIHKSDFSDGVWQRAHVNGTLYAVPFDAHPFVMYYNTKFCEKAGLLDADGKLKKTEGPEAFLAQLRAAKKAAGTDYALLVDSLGTGTVGPWRLFWSLYPQSGGTLLNPGGTALAVDDTKLLTTLTFMRRMAEEKLLNPTTDYGGASSGFASGTAPFFFNGDWDVSTMVAAKTPFSMTRFPSIFGGWSAEADSHSFVFPHRNSRDPQVQKASYEFIAWMLKNSVEWGKAGHIPAYLPVHQDPAYLALEPQSEYRDVINDVAYDPSAWFSGSASKLELDLGSVYSTVLGGSRTPAQGVAATKDVLTTLLKAPNPFPGGVS
jgi:multiple sugar transport system substrate-binding protein